MNPLTIALLLGNFIVAFVAYRLIIRQHPKVTVVQRLPTIAASFVLTALYFLITYPFVFEAIPGQTILVSSQKLSNGTYAYEQRADYPWGDVLWDNDSIFVGAEQYSYSPLYTQVTNYACPVAYMIKLRARGSAQTGFEFYNMLHDRDGKVADSTRLMQIGERYSCWLSDMYRDSLCLFYTPWNGEEQKEFTQTVRRLSEEYLYKTGIAVDTATFRMIYPG